VSREEVAELLQRFGVTPTNQRLDVGQVILSRPQHLSADQIISAVQCSGSRVSKATVYNTLNLFCERGLLRTVNVDPTRQFYDPTTSNHHHFYNEDTGELVDIPPEAVEFKRVPDLPAGTQASGVEVVMRIRNRTP
jgi:Fur family iron response transcriptional regulator